MRRCLAVLFFPLEHGSTHMAQQAGYPIRRLASGTLAVLLAGFVGCSSDPEPSNACQEAAQMVAECTGSVATPPESCQGEVAAEAEDLLAHGCDALLEPGKADEPSKWCKWSLRWLGRCPLGSPEENLEIIQDLATLFPNTEALWLQTFDGQDPEGNPCEVEVRVSLSDEPGMSAFDVGVWPADGLDAFFFFHDIEVYNVIDYERTDDQVRLHVHVIPDSPSLFGDNATDEALELELLGEGEYRAWVRGPLEDEYLELECTFSLPE